jgi:hypothetical protein
LSERVRIGLLVYAENLVEAYRLPIAMCDVGAVAVLDRY